MLSPALATVSFRLMMVVTTMIIHCCEILGIFARWLFTRKYKIKKTINDTIEIETLVSLKKSDFRKLC